MTASHREARRFPLLESKLRAPTRTGWSLDRDHLFGRLDNALQGRLAVVAAPAGFGKTVLIEEWTHRLGSDTTVGWLSVDGHDDDASTFWWYLVECVRRFGAHVDERLVAELREDISSVNELVAELVNALASLDGRQVLVLDDLHLAVSKDVLDPLFRFVDSMPPSALLVVISRFAPNWPLERMRARGEAEVIGADVLAFDRQETAVVLTKEAPGVLLNDSEIDVLYRRSEGWPVAVTLAAHGLRRQSAPHRLVADFGGSDGVVAGFLLEEVLSGLSPGLHRFLLDLSVLDRFSVDVASALINKPAGELVAELMAEHLFVVSIDDQGNWYRLHQLIRDLLLADLARSDPARVRVLHRRAATWYEANDNIGAAVEHLVAAGEFDGTVALIDRVVDQQYLAGETDSIIRWLKLLPVDQLEQRPGAASLLARMLIAQGWFDEARGWIDIASRATQTDSQHLDVIVARLRLERYLGQEDAVMDTLTALDALVEVATDPHTREAAQSQQADALAIRAMCHLFLGQTHRYRETLVELSNRRGELGEAAAFTVEPVLANAHAEDGDLQKAASLARVAIERADRTGTGFYTMTYAHLALAQVAWCRGQLEGAQDSLRRAAQLDPGAAVWMRTLRAIRAAETLASIGRHDQVDDILESAWHGTAGARTPPNSRFLIVAWGMVINAIHDRREPAYSWLAELERLDASGRPPLFLWAEAELLRGNPQMVIARFGSDGSHLPVQPLPRLRCGLALFKALESTGQDSELVSLIGPLLAQAEQYELIQPVVECRGLVSHIESIGPDGPSHRFLAQLRPSSPSPPETPAPLQLPEPISCRELDLIRLLPTRLTNQEIATELYVSLNTVKTHLRNIYRKLGVPSRDSAIARCKELDLL
ncbi:MAG: AAA family ATPase [Actinomycetia bacterium]|nr:AAA family ATPase [Actinomycetes bacterium]